MLNSLAILVIQENTINIVEAHLLDRKINTSDFYGSALCLCLIGSLRPEQKFTSFDALIAQINLTFKRLETINIVEAHLLDRKIKTSDFYGSALRLCLTGFLRML